MPVRGWRARRGHRIARRSGLPATWFDRLVPEPLAAARLAPGPAEGVRDGNLLLVYTAGTTGRTKGAMHTRAGMPANAVAAIAAQGLDARSRVPSVLPLFHVGGLCIQTLPALAVGGTLSLLPRFEAGAWFDAVLQWRPTTTLLVQAVMKALIEHPHWAAADRSLRWLKRRRCAGLKLELDHPTSDATG